MSERDLFTAALHLQNLAGRAAFLDQACAGNAPLRDRLETLLRVHGKLGGFLEAPEAGATRTHESNGAGTASFHSREEQVGAILAGRYKLLQQIGEGGMGTVWMADQTEPVKRRVAVKLIRVERGQSKTILARFEAERQAIALMDHPHIAKLLDAGTTDAGLPFFVMELVKGIPLTDYCDGHRLSIPQRLGLFQQICSAVQHAHQKGIIHRDLKPTNILVESHDGLPVPKVIDFGLAKATTGLQLSEHTLFTAFGSVMGTPLYMAPEQAKFNAVDVDTRADVYALGVILYELLTGTTPLARETIRQAQLDEMLKLIREQEAPTPSSRLSTAINMPSVAANRQMEPQSLGRFLRGELDWIVMKSLAKERGRRYDSASDFAQDVQRFLNHEPVTAGPPTARYRLRKFVQRNRGQVLAGGAVLVLLLAGIAGTTLGFVRATAQRDRAQAAEEEARTASRQATRAEAEAQVQKNQALAARAQAADDAAVAQGVNEFLLSDLLTPASQGPFALGGQSAPNPDVTIRELMERAESRVAARFADRPLIEANVREVIAQSHLQPETRKYDRALANLERAAQLKAAHYGPLHEKTMQARVSVATWTAEAGRESEPMKRRGFQLLDDLRDTLASVPDPLASELVPFVYAVAHYYATFGRPRDAIPLYQRYLRAAPSQIPRIAATSILHNTLSLAEAHRSAGEIAEADRLVEGVRADIVKLLTAPVELVQVSMLLAVTGQLQKLGKPVSTEPLFATLRINAERLEAGNDRDAMSAWCGLGSALNRSNRTDDAIQAYERGQAVLKRQMSTQTNVPAWGFRFQLYQDLGDLYLTAGRSREAFETYGKYMAAVREKGVNSSIGTTYLFVASNAFRRTGHPADAIPLLREAMELNRKASGLDSGMATALELQLGMTYHEARQPNEAIAIFDDLIGRLKPADGTRDKLRRAYEQRAKAREALVQFEQAAADWHASFLLCAENSLDRWNALAFGAIDRLRAGQEVDALRDADILAANDPQYPLGLYNAACLYSLASARPVRPGMPDRETAAAKAVQLLQQAVAKGATTLTGIVDDADFDPIRDRNDFRRLLADLQGKQLVAARKRDPSKGRPLSDEIALYCTSLLKIGAFAEAEPLLRECLALRQASQPDDWRTFNTMSLLGGALLGQQKYAEAGPLLRAGYEGMKQREKTIPTQGRTRIPEAIDRRIELAVALNQPEDAKARRAERATYKELAPPPRKPH